MAPFSPVTACRFQMCWLLLLMSLSSAMAASEPLTDKTKTIQSLLQLRQIVLEGLEQRLQKRLHQQHRSSSGSGSGFDTAQESVKRVDEDSAGGGASLSDVFDGARAYATVMAAGDASPGGTAWTTTPADVEAVSSPINGTAVALSPIAAWFVHLYSSMLLLLPLAAWIAIIAAAGLLLIGLIVLIIYCCCRNRGKIGIRGARNRREGPPQTLLYNDLDIVGKEQPPYGIINFSLEYDVPKCQLIITASSCIGLPKDLKELDPYVVIRVSKDTPDSKHQQQQVHSSKPERSKVVKNSVDPAFNYTHIVKIRDKRALKKKVITFEVYDWDIGTRHRMIARRVLNLARLGEKLDEILGRKVEFSRNLQAGVNQEPTGPGDVCLALCYSPQERHLWVHIIECKGVFLQRSDKPDFETMPNTYVKLVLSLAGSTKRMVKSTAPIKESRNPYFNEQFVFKMEPIQMQVASLRVVLMHRTETLRIKRVVGSLTLSLTAEKESLALLHWRETVLNHGRPMARWHSLVTPDEEHRQAELKAAAELKRQLELADDIDASLVRPAQGADDTGGSGGAAAGATASASGQHH